jgi:hypothetical protein
MKKGLSTILQWQLLDVNVHFIFRNLGDLSCLSHEEESRSFKSFGKVVEKGICIITNF